MIRELIREVHKKLPFAFGIGPDRISVFIITEPIPTETQSDMMDFVETLGFREARIIDYTQKPQLKINIVSYEYQLVFDRTKLKKDDEEFISSWSEDSSVFKRETLRKFKVIN